MTVLEVARRDKGWSQKDLGDRVHIHQTFVSMIERGYGVPSLNQRLLLARALGVDPARLLDPVVVTEEKASA